MSDPIPRLPEEAQVVLKRRKQNDSRRIKRAKIEAQRQTPRGRSTRIHFKRAEAFIASYRHREHERSVLIRKQKLSDNERAQRTRTTAAPVPAVPEKPVAISSACDGRIILVVRTTSMSIIDNLQRQALYTMRLRSPKAAVFMRLDAKTAAQLRMLSAHTLWGTPSARMVRELLFKRARAVESGKLVPLNDNRVVERALGSINMLCVEDLLVELLAERASAHFDAVARFIVPMRIAVPRSVLSAAMTRQRALRVDGDFAARQKLIDVVLSKLL